MKKWLLSVVTLQLVFISLAFGYSVRSRFDYPETRNGVKYQCWKSSYSKTSYEWALDNIQDILDDHYNACTDASNGKSCSKYRSPITCVDDEKEDCNFTVKSCYKK